MKCACVILPHYSVTMSLVLLQFQLFDDVQAAVAFPSVPQGSASYHEASEVGMLVARCFCVRMMFCPRRSSHV